MAPALWIASWLLITLVGVIGSIASINSMRFVRRVAAEAHGIAPSSSPAVLDRSPFARLPAPVERYLRKAITRDTFISSVRLRHGGRFRTTLDGSWSEIRGRQFFRASPPAFIWWGRVRAFPGIWFDARDRSVDGAGNMLVMIESTVRVADATGPELDQGALLRLLGEIVWFPTAFLDSAHVQWTAVDDRRAQATLRVDGRQVTGQFEFGDDDLPVSFTANRYRDVGGGAVLTPFVGRMSDYRRVDGALVPYRVVASWLVDGRAAEYADFRIERIEFDREPDLQ